MSKSNQEVLDELAARLRAQQAPRRNSANGHARGARPAKPAVPDEIVIEKCRSAENSAKFSALFDAGDAHAYHKGDDSVADLALLGLLTFWTQDEAQLERLFTGSALGRREKWRKRADYRRRTIAKALSEATEVYDWERNGRGCSSSSSETLKGGDDDENNETPKIVWFSELGEPQEREYLVERVGAKSYPVVAFGAGGVAKSFAMLAAGIAIAGTGEEWLGLKVLEHGHVLYLDFELDAAEQHRRVRILCHGLGVLVPKRLAYLSGVGIGPAAAFEQARAFVKEYKAKAVIIDSMGLAMEGDMERGRDVLAFHSRHVNPLRRLGATPFIVDHEGKLQAGEKHRDKSPFGSAYKAWAARSVLQFQLEEHDKENAALDIRVRQTKTNFGPPLEPFGVKFTFAEQKVSIQTFELEDTALVEERMVPVRERILGALRTEPATVADLEKLTGAARGTIYNKLSELIQTEVVKEDGYRGRSKVYRVFSSSDTRGGSGDDENEEGAADRAGDDPVRALLEDPPEWLSKQLDLCRVEPERFVKPTAVAVAAEVFGSEAPDLSSLREVAHIIEEFV